jgi:hypothetical protein
MRNLHTHLRNWWRRHICDYEDQWEIDPAVIDELDEAFAKIAANHARSVPTPPEVNW